MVAFIDSWLLMDGRRWSITLALLYFTVFDNILTFRSDSNFNVVVVLP